MVMVHFSPNRNCGVIDRSIGDMLIIGGVGVLGVVVGVWRVCTYDTYGREKQSDE